MLYHHVRTTVVKAHKKVVTNEHQLSVFSPARSGASPAFQLEESISHTGSVSETHHHAEDVERFSSISNVSSIRGDRSVASLSKRNMQGTPTTVKKKKKISWKADIPPLNIPDSIDVDPPDHIKNNNNSMEGSLPRLPLGEMMIEEGEEELDEEPDTTDTDLEQSGCSWWRMPR